MRVNILMEKESKFLSNFLIFLLGNMVFVRKFFAIILSLNKSRKCPYFFKFGTMNWEWLCGVELVSIFIIKFWIFEFLEFMKWTKSKILTTSLPNLHPISFGFQTTLRNPSYKVRRMKQKIITHHPFMFFFHGYLTFDIKNLWKSAMTCDISLDFLRAIWNDSFTLNFIAVEEWRKKIDDGKDFLYVVFIRLRDSVGLWKGFWSSFWRKFLFKLFLKSVTWWTWSK